MCKDNFRVQNVSAKKLKDYDGMNYYAAKKLGYPYIDKKNVIHVRKGLSEEDKVKTVRHEKLEATLMHKYGYKYWRAHMLADNDRLYKKHFKG